MTHLLDKLREALLKARESGVGVAAISGFLRESGIPVSEATLRQYFHLQSGGKKPRRKPATKPAAGPKLLGEAIAQPEPRTEAKPVQTWIEEQRAENPPVVRDVFAPRSRGPRIADPKNL